MTPRALVPAFCLAIVLFTVPGLTARAAFESLFAPKAELWHRWSAHDAQSRAVIDHKAWNAFLERYVAADAAGLNRIAYARVSAADRQALERYIARLAGLAITKHNREEQRAYWINLYNALTVKVVLDHYPVASIKDIDISPGLFANGPWDKKLIEIEGEAIGLNDIEHRILRPIWQDARLHYALNCAAVGCPDLMRAAFTAANTERLLEKGARDYVNGPRGARFEDGRLIVSKIYAWFEEDFGGGEHGVIEHLERYAEPALAERLGKADGISDYVYDWSLNGAR